MSDQQQNQQQQQQGKQKGGDGNKGPGKGISLGGSFDATLPTDWNGLKTQAVGHAANAVGFIASIFVAAFISQQLKSVFGVKDAAPPAGPTIDHPGKLVGAIYQMKGHPNFEQTKPKMLAALGVEQPAPTPAPES